MPYKDPEKKKAQEKAYRIKNHDRIRKYWNEWHKNDRTKNPDKVKKQVRKATLKMNHGITLEEYDKMFQEQNGLCAICLRSDTLRELSVDHNHETGKIRGLLCGKCNLAIGNLEENIEHFYSAIRYLEKHNVE